MKNSILIFDQKQEMSLVLWPGMPQNGALPSYRSPDTNPSFDNFAVGLLDFHGKNELYLFPNSSPFHNDFRDS